jgi:hypothetical protein
MLRDTPSLELLADRLRNAPAVDPEIFSAVIVDCTRLPVMRRAGKTDRFDLLVATGAWTDAAFALIALELPAWSVRRLVYEEGEWHCSLSQQRNLPVELDDAIDAHHEVLPLAILSAFLEARRDSVAPKRQTVPQVRSAPEHAVCCDNFA